MNRRKRTVVIAVAALVFVTLVATLLVRSRSERRRVFREATTADGKAPVTIPPVDRWSETFRSLPPAELAEFLARIEKEQPENYKRWSLAYLHARVLIETDELDDAKEKLAPYLAESSPLRDVALYHAAAIAAEDGEAEEASRQRQTLIASAPKSPWFDQAVDEELEYLGETADPAKISAFAEKVLPPASTERRREISARMIEAFAARKAWPEAKARALALLRGGTSDDPSDRAARVLDAAPIVSTLTPAESELLGEAMKNHRHYDRAVAHLTRALQQAGLKPEQRDSILFEIGRAHFGAERFADAMRSYLGGAAQTRDPQRKATFLFHASRCAQLSGDDAAGEKHLTAAIAVPGKFTATTAATTQRLRTNARQGDMGAARRDLEFIRKQFGRDKALYDASLAFALAQVARGDAAGARVTLDSVPRAMLDDYARAEVAYWKARSLEKSDPRAAVRAYLPVLRSEAPTHFAYFARMRFASPQLKPHVEQELAIRAAQVKNLVAAKRWELAKDVETDRILLTPFGATPDLGTLASIYRELKDYREVLELQPDALPQLPLENENDRGSLLMALGLYDEATDAIGDRWGVRGRTNLLTRALAFNRASASRESILAAELLARTIPKDFVPELLPVVVRQLLYPRYFASYIEEDAQRYEADPTLVLSIMREESRFNPRAKSAAAARGLLQFIITTARDIGREVGIVELEPDDLYDPRTIIRLGAKYVATLTSQFKGNRYNAVAAYNAGPKQVALWARMQPGAGDDFFLSSINFDETKHYVRKVMNSYERYGEIYGTRGITGGVRAEP